VKRLHDGVLVLAAVCKSAHEEMHARREHAHAMNVCVRACVASSVMPLARSAAAGLARPIGAYTSASGAQCAAASAADMRPQRTASASPLGGGGRVE
jgi:hypothetical protein